MAIQHYSWQDFVTICNEAAALLVEDITVMPLPPTEDGDIRLQRYDDAVDRPWGVIKKGDNKVITGSGTSLWVNVVHYEDVVGGRESMPIESQVSALRFWVVGDDSRFGNDPDIEVLERVFILRSTYGTLEFNGVTGEVVGYQTAEVRGPRSQGRMLFDVAFEKQDFFESIRKIDVDNLLKVDPRLLRNGETDILFAGYWWENDDGDTGYEPPVPEELRRLRRVQEENNEIGLMPFAEFEEYVAECEAKLPEK